MMITLFSISKIALPRDEFHKVFVAVFFVDSSFLGMGFLF